MKKLRELYERLNARLFSILHCEKGQTLVEYALLIVLIAVVVYIMVTNVGKETNTAFSKINAALYSP